MLKSSPLYQPKRTGENYCSIATAPLAEAASPRSIEHLLKLTVLPDFARHPNGWLISIAKQRAAIRKLIDHSPVLRNLMTDEFLTACYADSHPTGPWFPYFQGKNEGICF